MNVDLVIHSASQLLTLRGGPQRGDRLGELGIIADGALAIHDGRIVAVGATPDLLARFTPRTALDATGRVVMPGFVDPHTHAVWAGDRAAEFEMRLAGAMYLEIMNAGGGILSTVRQTRAASAEALAAETRARLHRMLAHGTTTAEVKTGYGLQTDAELRQLQVVEQLDAEGPLQLVPTFLGAHAVPAEYRDRQAEYVDHVVEAMLPRVKAWAGARRLPFVDVFCDEGAFTLDESRRILTAAQGLGSPLKIHADEFKSLGAARLAAELGAVSADHLVVTPPDEIVALGRSETVAVALPGTPFGLGLRDYTPAAEFLKAGAILALASDLNPGTSWCESMQFVIALACRHMRLTPAQAIAAATINAAHAVGLSAEVGSLEPGKQADVLVLDVASYRHLGYRFGTNLVSTVIKRGEAVWQKGESQE